MSDVRHAERPVLDRDSLAGDAALGALAGFVLGWVDAIQLVMTAGHPIVRAAYKVPLHVLWISPLLAAPVLALLAVLTGIAARSDLRRRSFGPLHSHQFVSGVVTFVVVFLAGWVLRVLHPVSVVILALSTSLVMARVSMRFPADMRPVLRRPLLTACSILPVLLIAAATLPRVLEWRQLQKLPPVAGGDNVIFLVLDTVRRDRFYRPDSVVVAPALEALADEARWFPNAWASSSWSLPSHATLLSGRPPSEHGADWPTLQLADSVRPITVHLADRGVVAAAFSGNDSWVVPAYLGDGFVTFESLTIAVAGQRSIIGRFARPFRKLLGSDELSGGMPAEVLLDHAWSFIQRQSARPFFLYICLMDVNRAYYEATFDAAVWEQPASMATRVAAYDSALARVDRAVASFTAKLRRSGLLDRSVLVVTSDHGESFGAGYADDRDPRGHGTGLYPEQLRVPLWIRAPGGAWRGVDARHVSLEGVAGTALHLAGQSDSVWRQLPPDTATASGPVRFSLRYGDRRMGGRIDGDWLRLFNFVMSPPAEDSVALIPRVTIKDSNGR